MALFLEGFRVYLISVVCRCLGAWNRCFSSFMGCMCAQACTCTMTHTCTICTALQQSTHTVHTHKCKHKKYHTIHFHGSWHWRTLTGFHRFMLIFGDWFLCWQNELQKGCAVSQVTSVIQWWRPAQTSGYKPQGSLWQVGRLISAPL